MWDVNGIFTSTGLHRETKGRKTDERRLGHLLMGSDAFSSATTLFLATMQENHPDINSNQASRTEQWWIEVADAGYQNRTGYRPVRAVFHREC